MTQTTEPPEKLAVQCKACLCVPTPAALCRGRFLVSVQDHRIATRIQASRGIQSYPPTPAKASMGHLRVPGGLNAMRNDNLWQGVNGVNNPCPEGFRLPTEAELEAERRSWPSDNTAGALASPLKWPVAGNRCKSNGSLYAVGSAGLYRSSTVDGSSARSLYFTSSGGGIVRDGRARGFSVRCIKD